MKYKPDMQENVKRKQKCMQMIGNKIHPGGQVTGDLGRVGIKLVSCLQ